MKDRHDSERGRLRSAAVQDAHANLLSRQRTEQDLARTSEALRASEGRLRSVADATPAIIWTADETGRITFNNRRWLEYTGITPEEGGHNWPLRVLHPDDLVRCTQAWEQAHEQGTDFEIEARIRRHDGEYRWFLTRATPIRGAEDRILEWCGVSTDIDELKLADAARETLAAIVESSDDAIISKSLDGVIASWNRAAEQLFGYTADEAIGRPITMLIPPDRQDEEPKILERLRRGERVDHFETVRVHKDGTRIDISLTISPVRDSRGRIIGASKIARDIGDRKHVERTLRDADRRKGEFLAVLAHELRNPLAPIRNAAIVLQMDGLSRLEYERSIAMIDRQVAHMTRLIDDLLDVARISRGQLELRRERVVISDLVEIAVEVCRHAIQSRGHHLSVSFPGQRIELDADRARLIQVFSNLITNAAKYTPPGGRIDLKTTATDDHLELSVKDSGIGIPPEKLSEVFDLFTQLDRSSEREGGLGVGLALARQLIELHGGTIEGRSQGVGHGSEFLVTLPIPKMSPNAPGANARTGPAAVPHRRILILDDNRDALESLALLLRMRKHEVHTAEDGPAALACAQKVLPDVALLDIGMPGMDGYEVARRIRAEDWGKGLYLVALSGWGQEADKLRAREAGFDAHLVKPVAFEALNRVLANIGTPADGRAGLDPVDTKRP